MQTINLDLSKKGILPILYAKQADVGRKFKAIITDGGTAYPVPAGAAVSIWYSGASGEGNYTDIGANSAVSVSGNEIIVEMITQMLANYGVGTVCIVIHTADGKQLGTWNIPYMVEPLPGMGSGAAQAYFTAFSKAVEGLPYPDASLSAPGKAAEAAAVGAALAGKAPVGYGLGTGGVYPASVGLSGCAIAKGGFYRWDTNPGDAPFSNAVMLVMPRDRDKSSFQIAYCCAGSMKGTIAVRQYSSTTENEWEYVNPPMSPGVEYRTMKRVNGLVVYTKYFSFGTMPKATAKRVQIPAYTDAYSIQNMKFIMKHNTTDNAMQLAYGADPGFFMEEADNDVINLVVSTTGDFSAYTGYVTIEYTK